MERKMILATTSSLVLGWDISLEFSSWVSATDTVANSRETNKQPQLQKQAQYFFDDLLSSNIIY